jgi:hypothetical protein
LGKQTVLAFLTFELLHERLQLTDSNEAELLLAEQLRLFLFDGTVLLFDRCESLFERCVLLLGVTVQLSEIDELLLLLLLWQWEDEWGVLSIIVGLRWLLCWRLFLFDSEGFIDP